MRNADGGITIDEHLRHRTADGRPSPDDGDLLSGDGAETFQDVHGRSCRCRQQPGVLPVLRKIVGVEGAKSVDVPLIVDLDGLGAFNTYYLSKNREDAGL